MKFVAPLRYASSVLEAAYHVGQPMDAWLKRLLRTVAVDMDGGSGLYALAMDFRRDDFALVAPPVFHRLPREFRLAAPSLAHVAPAAVMQHFRAHMVEFGSVSQLFGSSGLAPVRDRGLPFVDSVGISVQDGEGTGLQLISPMTELVRVHGRSRAAWRKVGLHLGLAWRLRRRLERGADTPEALLENGKLIDARGDAQGNRAREALIQATKRIERARTAARRDDPEHVLELWRGLVSGRWSLVDQWESDGRRYVAAYENVAAPGPIQRTAPWEMQALQMHLLRANRAEIAFALGISPSTVERVLSTAARRVGLRNRAELARLSEPQLMTRLALDVAQERVDVLRLEEPALPAAWRGRLTPAQLDVATAAARGKSDSEIAQERGTSVRTVSNQLAAIYGRLEIEGRSDLVRGGARKARRG